MTKHHFTQIIGISLTLLNKFECSIRWKNRMSLKTRNRFEIDCRTNFNVWKWNIRKSLKEKRRFLLFWRIWTKWIFVLERSTKRIRWTRFTRSAHFQSKSVEIDNRTRLIFVIFKKNFFIADFTMPKENFVDQRWESIFGLTEPMEVRTSTKLDEDFVKFRYLIESFCLRNEWMKKKTSSWEIFFSTNEETNRITTSVSLNLSRNRTRTS